MTTFDVNTYREAAKELKQALEQHAEFVDRLNFYLNRYLSGLLSEGDMSATVYQLELERHTRLLTTARVRFDDATEWLCSSADNILTMM